ncbi:aspartate aminotransferase family protein [candidate division WOR-3 bacterium]|nr:aspartate aminotransferase family protein [candidate division WOR-3 bacterium]
MSKARNKRSFEDLVKHINDLLAPSLAQDWPNLPVVRAEGAYIYGQDGKRYLDFLAGFGACNVGHNHSRVVEAAKSQMSKMIHTAIGVTNYESILRLADELGQVTPGDANVFFFGNSGAEAVDGAIKLARYSTQRKGIIAFLGGFHGRSLGTTSVTSSKAKYRTGHGPFLPDVYFAQFPYPFRSTTPDDPEKCGQSALDDLLRLFEYVIEPEDVAALLVEPVQGEGGYIIPPKSWLSALREICDKYGILLIFDEVQTGFGRTGEWFAAQSFDVQPDILTLAKGIANGFPLGATAARAEIMQKWGAASHGTTCGGNPVSCAAGLAVIEVIREENLLVNAREQGAYMLERLRELQTRTPIIGDVRGLGLMVAVEFVKPDTDKEPNSEVVQRILRLALDKDLLLYPCGHWTQVIRLIPPLTVTREQIDKGLDIFSSAILEATIHD